MGQRASAGVVSVVKLIALTLTAAIISGCTTAPPPIETPVEVKVPVATPVYCQVGKLSRPSLPLSTLKPDSAPADTIRTYAATVAILKGAVRQRDFAIEGCTAPLGDPVPPTKVNAGNGSATE